MKNLDIIVPCYNEELVIAEFFKKLSESMEKVNLDWKVIFVNDGSTDLTEEIIDELMTLNKKRIFQIILSKNSGHMNAIKEGYKYSDADLIVTMDSDLQDPPIIIPQMINEMWENKKVDCISALRISRKSDSLYKKITAYLFYYVFEKILKIPMKSNVADFRLITRDLKNRLLEYNGNFPVYRILIPLLTNRINYINFQREKRFAGKSHYTFKKMWELAFISFVNFSDVPYKLISHLFKLIILFDIIAVLGVTLTIIYDLNIKGWASIVVLLLFFSTIILSFLLFLSKYTYLNFIYLQGIPKTLLRIKQNEK